MSAERPILLIGSSGSSVLLLQQRLGVSQDGIFGPVTEAAVRRFQRLRGLDDDGIVGPKTWSQLMDGATPTANRSGVPQGDEALRGRLMATRQNRYLGVAGQCYRYVEAWVKQAGGKSVGSLPSSKAGRGTPVERMGDLEARGLLRVGDVIYANRKPGADPSSTNLAYGPHWFVYLGGGRFGDQHTVRSAAQMAAYVPGRLVDEIIRPFT